MNILFRSTQTANIFVVGQTVSLTLSHDQTAAVTFRVVVRDELGDALSSQSVSVAAKQTANVPCSLAAGYYEATATAVGTGVSATAILAVIDPLPAGASSEDSPFGVQTHFQQNMNTDVLPLLTLAGIRHVRDEQIWQVVETAGKGAYNYSQYAPYMAALEQAGIDPLLTADFANPTYDGGNTPYSAAGTAGYAAYTAALAQRWQAQAGAVEVWNEYNGSFCSGPATANRPEYYTAMLAATYGAIKAASPATTVLGGATVLMPAPYFQKMFAAGLYDNLDGYCVHAYYSPAESIPRYFSNLRTVEAAYSGSTGPKPIWVTECGLDQGDDTTNARRELGIYLVKLLTTLMSVGAQRAYWYLARDFGSFTTGLLHDEFFAGGSYAPTVAYVAFAALNKYLTGATYLGRDSTSDRRTYSHHFQLADGSDFRVLYSTRPGPSPVVVHASTGGVTAAVNATSNATVTILDYMGGAITATNPVVASGTSAVHVKKVTNALLPTFKSRAHNVTLTLTDEPVYVLGPVTSIVENYGDRLLAESLLDYSSTTQGANGWTYGWRTDQDPTFHAGTAGNDDYDYFWVGPFYYLQVQAGSAIGSAGRNPDGSWYQVWATRRYTPSETVSARIVGSASRGSVGYGDGSGLNILLNGQTLFSQALGTTADTCEASFDLTVTLVAGQPLDFCITPGPGYDNSYDACTFDVQIIAQA